MYTKVGMLRFSALLVSLSYLALHHFWFHPFSFHVFYWFHHGAYLFSADAVILQLRSLQIDEPLILPLMKQILSWLQISTSLCDFSFSFSYQLAGQFSNNFPLEIQMNSCCLLWHGLGRAFCTRPFHPTSGLAALWLGAQLLSNQQPSLFQKHLSFCRDLQIGHFALERLEWSRQAQSLTCLCPQSLIYMTFVIRELLPFCIWPSVGLLHLTCFSWEYRVGFILMSSVPSTVHGFQLVLVE